MANTLTLLLSALSALLFLQLAAAQAAPAATPTCAEAPKDIWLVGQNWENLSLQTIGVWYANVPAEGPAPQVRPRSLKERRKRKKGKKGKGGGEEEQPGGEEQPQGQAPAPGAECTFTQSSTGGQDTLLFKNSAIYRQIVCVTTVIGDSEMMCYWLNAGDSCTTTTSSQWLFFSVSVPDAHVL
ncbi:hypothetical protein CTRI78_v006607 [Colletotrichum trifolii]|uniref:Uncharacterized protein n=1 Tax=Colletotrichum trifolii TaxID=5466 RepID=A0A4R8RIM7_COLTR|nr:hypothetical protein CTRI78_v006607 [Colletotrichum trifolii]